jgi:DNA-binding transcriptional LysR family regulator
VRWWRAEVSQQLRAKLAWRSPPLASLEAHLGAQLLMHTSRNLSLTKAGHDFYESGARLIGDFEAAESRVGRGQASPSGVVRVTVAHALRPDASRYRSCTA